MKKQRFNPISNCKLVFATSLVLSGCLQVQAEPLNSSGNQTAAPIPSVVFNAPSIPTGTGRPDGRRRGVGSRTCRRNTSEAAAVEDVVAVVAVPEETVVLAAIAAAKKQSLIALVPSIPSDQGQGAEFVGGLTTVERPTFWFYTTYQPPLIGEFILQDKDEKKIYITNAILPTKPGFIQISLPSNVPPLEIGKTYNWYFKILCNPNSPPLYFVNGWIQRTSLNPDLESELKNATLQQKFALYASNGIWYEALTAAAELRRTNSSDRNWANLLQDVGLSEIASEAIAAN